MDNERIREICMALPHVAETVGWGHHLVYWVGDRDIGGKMFASTDLDGSGVGVLAFHCGAERFHELLERDGIRPTPYSAKFFWVTLERWDALRNSEWEAGWIAAHEITLNKLPKRVRETLVLSAKAQAKLLADRRKVLAEKACVKEPTKKKRQSAK